MRKEMTKRLAGVLCSGGLLWAGIARAADNYYVGQQAENAADDNPGTRERPFKTIMGAFRAVGAKLQSGDHVWVLDGVYREGVYLYGPEAKNIPEFGARVGAERVTLAGYPGHEPTISASVKLEGWSRHRDHIWVTDFTWNKHPVHETLSAPFPVVFADGRPLKQIAGTVERYADRWGGGKGQGLDDLEAGSFFYDETARKLYVWLADNAAPADHVLETYAQEGRYGVHLGEGLRHFTFRNFKIRHTGLSVWGEFNVVENVDQAWDPFCGGYVRGHHSLILNSHFDWNGNSGMGGTARGVRLIRCRTNYNNWRGWHAGWHAGGVKFIADADNWIVAGHEAAHNFGDGIWFDAGMCNVTIEGCVAFRNQGNGIHYEVGSRGVIRNNICYENGYRGIYLSNSSDCLVLHNLVYRNGASGICAMALDRGGSPLADEETGFIPGRNNIVIGNILMDNCHPDFMPAGEDHTGHTWDRRPELIMPDPRIASNRGGRSDYNIFYRSDGRPIPFWENFGAAMYENLEAWRAQTGNDRHSVIARPTFVDLEKYDFRPARDSIAIQFVRPFPAGINMAYSPDGSVRPVFDRVFYTAGPYEAPREYLRLPKAKPDAKPLVRTLPLGPGVVALKTQPRLENLGRALETLALAAVADGVEGISVDGVPLALARPAQAIVLDRERPEYVLPAGIVARELHLLIALPVAGEGVQCRAVVTRQDGTVYPLRWERGQNIAPATGPWDGTLAEELPPAIAGWTGYRWRAERTRLALECGGPDNAHRLFLTTWKNDNEWIPLRELRFTLTDQNATVAILAVTAIGSE